MIANGRLIETPDDPGLGVKFAPDWRRQLAVSWLDGWFPPRKYYEDPYIRKYVAYLKVMKRMTGRTARSICKGFNNRFRDIADAEALYRGGDAGARNLLESLLLSGVDYRYVAMDLAPLLADDKFKPEELERVIRVVKTYERLFFNIRDDKGLVSKSIFTRTYFALGGAELDSDTPEILIPRIMAASYGYTVLMHYCHNSLQAHGKLESSGHVMTAIWNEIQVFSLGKIMRKDYNNFDSVGLLGKNIEYQKMVYETKAASTAKDDYKDFSRALLAVKRPKMLANAMTVEDRMRLDQASVDQFTARKHIAAQSVEDHGMAGVVQTWDLAKEANFADQGFGVKGV